MSSGCLARAGSGKEERTGAVRVGAAGAGARRVRVLGVGAAELVHESRDNAMEVKTVVETSRLYCERRISKCARISIWSINVRVQIWSIYGIL